VSVEGGPAEALPRRRRVDLPMLLERYGLLIAWGIVIAVFGALEPDVFLTQANFSTIFGSQAVIVVLTLALLIPLTAGDYDLSVAGVLSLGAMLVAVLNAKEGLPLGLTLLIVLAAGIAVGMVNGAFVTWFGVDPFIVTLGTGTVLTGVVLWISGSETISGVSTVLVDAVIGERLLGIPLDFWYGLLLCLVIWYVLEFTALGRRLLFVGRGRRVAALTGFNVRRLRFGALVTSGGIAAFAGIIYAGTTGGADPSSGASFLLPAFAAAFLGSTAIVPGRFNPWGSVVAVYFLVTGITGLTIMGAASYVQDLFYGSALVLAVTLSQLLRRGDAPAAGGPA
jgi:ribose transport system permease protein